MAANTVSGGGVPLLRIIITYLAIALVPMGTVRTHSTPDNEENATTGLGSGRESRAPANANDYIVHRIILLIPSSIVPRRGDTTWA